jgi:hypothetical protein
MPPSYESDITRFLRELKSRDPAIEDGQREGRSIYWDKDLDPDLYQRFRQSSVPQPAYVYQPRADE